MRDGFACLYTGPRGEAHLIGEANPTSFYRAVKGRMGLGLLFPVMGVPILMISIVFASTRAEDTWILENIVPAFIVFSVLLGISVIMGQSRVAELDAAIALGVLAIIPSLKYGFVYGNPDPMKHYGTAAVIAQTGSLATLAPYSETYAGTPLMHILPAITGLTAGLSIDAVIVITLFLQHFVIFLLVVETARKIFPKIERRLIVFLALIMVPVVPFTSGTSYALLPLAMFTYVFSTTIGWRANEMLLATAVMLSMILTHFVTTIYLLVALAGFAFSLLIAKRLGTSSGVGKMAIIPSFFAIFLLWLAFMGPSYVPVLALADFQFTQGTLVISPFQIPFLDVVQTLLFGVTRYIFSGLIALVASLIGLMRYRKTRAFLLFWWLFAAAVLMGVTIVLGFAVTQVYRFVSYASMVAPYFVCLLVSRRKSKAWLLDASRLKLIKATMLAALVLSMIAVYPMTPLYPKYDGKPILEDNTVNSIFSISGVKFFYSHYAVNSSQSLLTTSGPYSQIISLHPEFTNLGSISIELSGVHSLTELRNRVIVFDEGKSGINDLGMREIVLPLLSDGERDGTLSVVYSNGFFYVAELTLQ